MLKLVCFATSLSVVAGAVIAQPHQTAPKAILGHDRAADLGPTQARAWQDFRETPAFYGAMYITPGTDTAFYTRNFHDLSNAKAAAQKGCVEMEKLENGSGETCRLYAVSVPEGTSLNASDASGLGLEAWRAFHGDYLQKTGAEYGAFAISGGADYGMSWQWPDAAEARGHALARCKASVAESMVSLNNEGRRWVRRQGLDQCKVIDARGPTMGN